MKSAFTTMAALALAFTLSAAEDRCDHPFPDKGCDTEEILQYEREDCTPYHIFLARGSDEPYPGRGGNITGLICDKLSADGEECGFENIQFPAKSTAWGQDEWCKSASTGQANGQQQMKDYSEKCPDSKLVLIGFSQGAGVAQTILAGGGGHIFNCDQVEAPSLDRDTAPGKNIVAAVTFGAVIRSKDTPYTVGKGKPYPGQREHNPTQQAAINKYSDVLADYCHYGDGMCAVGSDPEELWSHLNYFLEHNEEVVEWVNKMAKSNGSTVSRPGGSGSSTSDSSATSASPRPAVQTASPTDSPKSDNSQAAKAGDSNAQNGASGVVVERGSVIAAVLALTAVFALF